MQRKLSTIGLLIVAMGAAVGSSLLFSSHAPNLPEMVKVSSGVFQYRLSGEFRSKQGLSDAPLEKRTIDRSFFIMKYQVSAKQYADCVGNGACDAPYKKTANSDLHPITGVSFKDAQDYAHWFTKITGTRWRLPTDAEWAYAAGSRFVDDALGSDTSTNDPSQRWLLQYRKYETLQSEDTANVKKRGAYGSNERGIYDFAGNIWEWTSTCFTKSTLKNGLIDFENCGVRIAEGRHRAYLTFFVKDAKSGGCTVGIPPEHLGFRLITDQPY